MLGVDKQIKEITDQKDLLINEFNEKISALNEKLEPLYNEKYGGLSKHQFEVAEKIAELERTTGFARSMRDDREGYIPFSQYNLFGMIPSDTVSAVIDIELVSDTEFRVLHPDFQNHVLPLEKHDYMIFKKKGEEVYKMQFRTTYRNKDTKFWVESDLFWMTHRDGFYDKKLEPYCKYSDPIDYLALKKARDEYVRKLEEEFRDNGRV